MTLHVKSTAGAPAVAPVSLGEHHIDTTSNDHYLSVGTTSADDWLLTTPARARINAQTGTTYALTASDNGKTVTLANANPVTLTLPEEATEDLVDGFQCHIIQRGAGQVTVQTQGSDTLESTATSLSAQHTKAQVIKLVGGAPSIWGLYGDLT